MQRAGDADVGGCRERKGLFVSACFRASFIGSRERHDSVLLHAFSYLQSFYSSGLLVVVIVRSQEIYYLLAVVLRR